MAGCHVRTAANAVSSNVSKSTCPVGLLWLNDGAVVVQVAGACGLTVKHMSYQLSLRAGARVAALCHHKI
jgi:hypothetical protein